MRKHFVSLYTYTHTHTHTQTIFQDNSHTYIHTHTHTHTHTANDPLDYDTWFDYLRLEESQGDLVKIRDIYERAIAQVPPVKVHT